MTTTTHLLHTIESLLHSDVRLIREGDEPGDLYGVVDCETGDMLGAGETESEALEDALKTIRGWETN